MKQDSEGKKLPLNWEENNLLDTSYFWNGY